MVKGICEMALVCKCNFARVKFLSNFLKIKSEKKFKCRRGQTICTSVFLIILLSGISFPFKVKAYESPTVPSIEDGNEKVGMVTEPNRDSLLNQSLNFPSDNEDQDDADEKNPREVQKAVCTITAGEVKASAEAVTTKTLKGVCGSAELQLAMSTLESKVFKELQEIKNLLLQQFGSPEKPNCDCNSMKEKENVKDQVSSYINPVTQTPLTINQPLLTSTPPVTPSSSHQPVLGHLKKATSPSISPPSSNREGTSPQLKSLPSTFGATSQTREKEVSKFNNTLLSDKDLKIFTYYWRLENFTSCIESGSSSTLDSPSFAIKGKPLHLKAYFHHLHRDFLYLQLEYATNSSPSQKMKNNGLSPAGRSNKIMLDMGLTGGGTLFKAIASNDQILFKYKITILDQQNLRSTKDLVSQEFHNLDTGFLIPNSALVGSSYVKNDTLLVQLFLYL